MKRQTLAASLLLLFAPAAFGQTQTGASKLRSPNGRVEITFALDAEGAPTYSVSYDGRTVVTPSRLGLVFKEHGPLSAGMEVLRVRQRARDSRYDLVVGKTSRVRDRFNELALELRETIGARRRLQLFFRAYDDGAAFR
ncbi:MAG TPA: glycoside hydrolase family 97 N-terminal domain-containing protein, partial [Pyrinomonadaceae bacterium]|nr:glycoside hydrolase family 97 N-terminal domain-containing protein [Pyrinomonadaceae bacterium]